MTKKLIGFILTLMLVISCNNDRESVSHEETLKFDYSAYNNRQSLFPIISSGLKTNKLGDNSQYEEFLSSVDKINTQYGTNVEVTDFDKYLIETQDTDLENFLAKGFISKTDYSILDTFFNNLEKNDFETSVRNLEADILSRNFTKEEFKKYNDFVNGLLIINDYYKERGVDIFKVSKNEAGKGRPFTTGCALSLAGNAVSTLGLTSCIVPGPNCAVAAIGKVISLVSIYYSC